jgi:hypothetical protein
MSYKYAREKAFATIAEKVAELQCAIADLQSVFETKEFGLEEWSESLSNDVDELEQEVFAEDEDE